MNAAIEDRFESLLAQAADAAADQPAVAAALAAEAAEALTPDDPDRTEVLALAASLFDGAGTAARLAGDWAESIRCHTLALAAVDAVDPKGIGAAVIAQNLAVTCKYTGRFHEAEQLYRRALSIAEAAGVRDLVATICHNLGGLAHAHGDHATGIPWARRSIAERERLDDPLALATDRGALAGLLIDAGALDEATEHLLAARAAFVDHHGTDHLEVIIVDGNLATVALRRGDLAEAERRARAAVAGKERHLGVNHPDLAVTLTTLGAIRRQRGDRRDAARLHRRALTVLRAAVEPDHPLLATIEDNLAVAMEG